MEHVITDLYCSIVKYNRLFKKTQSLRIPMNFIIPVNATSIQYLVLLNFFNYIRIDVAGFGNYEIHAYISP